VAPDARGNVPGGRVGCVRAWGLRDNRRHRLSTKVGPHVRNRRGWRVVRRPCNLERSILCVSALSKTYSPRSPIPYGVPRGRSRDRGCFRERSRRGSVNRTRRDEHKDENQSSRVNHRDISLGRTRARQNRQYRGVPPRNFINTAAAI